jgi:hypothetical protein
LEKEKAMKNIRLLLSLAAVVIGALSAAAADLAKIDRTLAREPAYRFKPGYCLLVFGPEAKTRVWLVLDGEVLYVDRNANGDLTEHGKRVVGKSVNASSERESADGVPDGLEFDVGEITETDGKTWHRLRASVRRKNGRWEITTLSASSAIEFVREQRTEGSFPLADRPQDAPLVHFDGSFTLAPRRDRGVVRAPNGQWNQSASDLHVLLGTPVRGKDCDSFVRTWMGYPGPSVRPVAEIEFPGKDPGGKPVKAQVTLIHR